MDLKQKIQYFWENERKHVIAFAIEIVVILVLLLVLMTRKDTALTGVLLNSSANVSKETFNTLNDEMLEGAKLSTDKVEVELINGVNYYLNDESKKENNYNLIQSIVKQMKKSKLDFLTGDQETVVVLAYSSFFYDLSRVLSEEQLALYKPYLRYIDQAVVDQIKKAAENKTDVDIKIPDCTKPEEMKKPIPVMIDMSKYESLTAFYPDTTDPIVFAVFENTPVKETVQKVIDFIMKEKLTGGE
jgi:hypothetical protein